MKKFRETQYDNKVNDFAAAVNFAFGYGGSMLAYFFEYFALLYKGLPFDLMLIISVVFMICYACYVNINNTCRKDKDEEEAIF